MALCGIGTSLGLEGVERWRLSGNLSTRMISRQFRVKSKSCVIVQKRSFGVQCSSSRKVVSGVESEVVSVEEEESGDVMRFKMSDFKVLDRVSLGLAGRVCSCGELKCFYENLMVVFDCFCDLIELGLFVG